jgi:AraC-like DNA-binding protein
MPRVKKSILRRDTQLLADGAYTFRDELDIEGTVTTTIATGLAWLLEYFEISEGELSFTSATTTVKPRGTRCWVFYPPFSLSRPALRGIRGTVTGKASTDNPGPEFKEKPFLFESNSSILETPVREILVGALNRQCVELNPRASVLSMRARQLIVKAYPKDPSIARIADRLGVSNAHLSRQFRRDYAMSPREYLHQLRIADVPLRLARGETIADVSGRAGYGDLSRFYKQFGKRTQTSPGRCRSMIAPAHS